MSYFDYLFGKSVNVYDLLVTAFRKTNDAEYLAIIERARSEYAELRRENDALKREIDAINRNIVSNIERDILHMQQQVRKAGVSPTAGGATGGVRFAARYVEQLDC
jgi:cell division protein FtsB